MPVNAKSLQRGGMEIVTNSLLCIMRLLDMMLEDAAPVASVSLSEGQGRLRTAGSDLSAIGKRLLPAGFSRS